MKKHFEEWADEFKDAAFSDNRLKKRVISIISRVSAEPETPLNQACLNWAETKAAYRFFNNARVQLSEILIPHINRTIERIRGYKRILAIQDTAYLIYSGQSKTRGLGNLWKVSGRRPVKGLIMHTTLAITLDGLPLGILCQEIFTHEQKKRESLNKKEILRAPKAMAKKESNKWIEALVNSKYVLRQIDCESTTVCDREGDLYELFEHAHILKSPILVRSKSERMIRGKRFISLESYEKKRKKLRNFMKSINPVGAISVQVPSRGGELGNPPRSAELEIRFARILMYPTVGYIRKSRGHKLPLSAIYAFEQNPPKGETPLEWMLITNIPIQTFEEAEEKVKWYSYRFQIETLHRILKSGFLVENCRLGTAESLSRYLTLMTVASWRIFWITILGRTSPTAPCTLFLTDTEWKVLYRKIYQKHDLPPKPISTKKAIHLIARLGGFLDRKGDCEPGVISLWRGWRRLNDLTEGWEIATAA